MKVATLEKFHLRGANQDPGDPGVGKVRGGGFFFLQGGGGTDPGWHYVFVEGLKNSWKASFIETSTYLSNLTAMDSISSATFKLRVKTQSYFIFTFWIEKVER